MIAIYSFMFSATMFAGVFIVIAINIALFIFTKNEKVDRLIEFTDDTLLGELLDSTLDQEVSPYERAGIFFLFEFFYLFIGVIATTLIAFAWPLVILYGLIVLMLKRKK